MELLKQGAQGAAGAEPCPPFLSALVPTWFLTREYAREPPHLAVEEEQAHRRQRAAHDLLDHIGDTCRLVDISSTYFPSLLHLHTDAAKALTHLRPSREGILGAHDVHCAAPKPPIQGGKQRPSAIPHTQQQRHATRTRAAAPHHTHTPTATPRHIHSNATPLAQQRHATHAAASHHAHSRATLRTWPHRTAHTAAQHHTRNRATPRTRSRHTAHTAAPHHTHSRTKLHLKEFATHFNSGGGLLGSAWFCLALGSARFCLLGSVWFCLALLDFAWFFLVLLGSKKPIEFLPFPGGLRISLC